MPVLQTQKMSQNGHEKRSRTERSSAAAAARGPVAAGAVRAGQWRPDVRPQRAPLPLVVHLAAAARRAVPHVAVRPVRAAHQRDGHRQHLRARRPPAILGSRVGAQHPLLPRPASDGPGSPAPARLVRAVRAERVAVLHATTRGTAARRSRPARLPHGGRPRGCLHGPHQDLPGASGEAQSAPRRLRGVLLPEGHRPLHDRCVRSVRRVTHRESSREVSVRPRGVLPEPVPQPTHEVRQTPPQTTFLTNSQLTSHRTAVLRKTSREDANRNFDTRHAAVRKLVLLALHGDHVTYDVATAGCGMIHALRLPAVPAESALRPLPEIHQGSAAGRRGDVIQRIP